MDSIVRQPTTVKEDLKNEQVKSSMPLRDKVRPRHDVVAWICGMLFILLIMLAIMLIGQSTNWYAPSTYVHYNTSSVSRFSPEPEFCNETNVKGRHGDSCGGRWYYWKLPVDKASSLTRGIVWLCYSLHQTLFWAIVYIAQTQKSQNIKGDQKFGTNLKWYNWTLLVGNALFVLLHLGQTHWTYDALAQDVTMASSQGSVITMIALIMALEYRDRGIIFMWPNQDSNDPIGRRTRLNQEPINAFRKYHGYLICWAMTYTFWYHPMENTWGHVLGFIHAGMIFLQGSLIYTEFHLNRYWRLINESWVMLHGSLVALQTRSLTDRQQWPMYFLGFGFLLFFTQIFGLKFWRKIHFGFRAIPPILFIIIAFIMCGTGVIRAHSSEDSNFSRLSEFFFVSLQLYVQMFVLWLLVYGMILIENRILRKSDKKSTSQVSDINVISNHVAEKECAQSNEYHEMTKHSNSIESTSETSDKINHFSSKRVIGITGFLLLHFLMVIISFLVHWTDVPLPLTSLMFTFMAIFTVLWSLTIMVTKISFTK